MKVFILAAMSADGFIGIDEAQRSLDWRSKADARYFIETTKQAGVMVMGSTTYKTFKMKRTPPGRRLLIYTHHPDSIVGEGVETTDEKPRDLVSRLEQEGAGAIAVCGGATINSLFLASGLVSDLYLTVEPVLFGSGIPLFRDPMQCKMTLLENKQLSDNTILLHYAINSD
jgi:dihydrofolate reductase